VTRGRLAHRAAKHERRWGCRCATLSSLSPTQQQCDCQNSMQREPAKECISTTYAFWWTTGSCGSVKYLGMYQISITFLPFRTICKHFQNLQHYDTDISFFWISVDDYSTNFGTLTEHGSMSPPTPTQYRLYRRRFLQVKRPN